MVKANGSLSPKFCKRHYEAIALAMQEAKLYAVCKDIPHAEEVIATVVKELATTFARDNGEFKRDRFIRACEPGANVRARS
jgi:hypothetical protein